MAETTTSADKFEEFRKYATEGPWEMVSDDNGMLISRRSVPGTSLYTQRGITVINAPVLRVRALIENVEARPKWDSMVAKGEMVRRVDENHVLARFTTEAQWPVAAREFYVEVVAEVEPSGKQTILANTPADHEQEFPVTADYVRGVAQNSGYILEPVAGSEPEQTKIIFLTQRLSPSFLLALLLLLLLLAGLSPRFPFSQWTPRAGSRPPSSRLRLRATRCVSAPSRRCARIPTPSERPPFFSHSPLLLLGARRANTQQLVSFLVPLILQAAIFSPSILILQKKVTAVLLPLLHRPPWLPLLLLLLQSFVHLQPQQRGQRRHQQGPRRGRQTAPRCSRGPRGSSPRSRGTAPRAPA